MTGLKKREFVAEKSDEKIRGKTPRHAAISFARRIEDQNTPAETKKDAKEDPVELRLKEVGSNRVHVYMAVIWEEEAPSNRPDWMGDTLTKVNLTKEGIEIL